MALKKLDIVDSDQNLSSFEKHWAEKAILFGSPAKGKAREENDIDLLVEALIEVDRFL